MNPATTEPNTLVTRWQLRAVVVVASWAVAAALVAGLGPWVEAATGARAALLFKVAAVVAVSGALVTRPMRARGLEPTPWTGLAWLALTIVTEMVAAEVMGVGWCELLGDPRVPWMRNVLMLSWLAAPILFSRVDEW